MNRHGEPLRGAHKLLVKCAHFTCGYYSRMTSEVHPTLVRDINYLYMNLCVYLCVPNRLSYI